MRPGAGTDVTVNSGRAIVAIFWAEPVGDRTRVRGQIEIGRPGLELEQRREVAIAKAGVDQLDDDLVNQGRDRHRNLQLAGRVQPQLEILAQQMAGEGRGEIQVDEGGRLVLAEGRSHYAAVDEVQVVGARDAAALGEHRGLRQDLGYDPEHQA